MQQQMNSNLAPYVTSSFFQHGLTATTGVLASIVAGVSRLPLARIINIWGRIEGFIIVNLLCAFGRGECLREIWGNAKYFDRSLAYGSLSEC